MTDGLACTVNVISEGNNRKIDLGLAVMDYLKIRGEPLPQELIWEYTEGGEPALVKLLNDNLNLLERCDMPIPVDILARVCRCHRTNITHINRRAYEKFAWRAYNEAKKIPDANLPRPNIRG